MRVQAQLSPPPSLGSVRHTHSCLRRQSWEGSPRKVSQGIGPSQASERERVGPSQRRRWGLCLGAKTKAEGGA